jgi:hypothetical protein
MMKTMGEFIQMGYEPEEVKHLLEIQKAFQSGTTVSLRIDHRTYDDLLKSIKEKNLDSNRLTIKDIEWKSGMVWFEGCDGWAGISEIVPF